MTPTSFAPPPGLPVLRRWREPPIPRAVRRDERRSARYGAHAVAPHARGRATPSREGGSREASPSGGSRLWAVEVARCLVVHRLRRAFYLDVRNLVRPLRRGWLAPGACALGGGLRDRGGARRDQGRVRVTRFLRDCVFHRTGERALEERNGAARARPALPPTTSIICAFLLGTGSGEINLYRLTRQEWREASTRRGAEAKGSPRWLGIIARPPRTPSPGGRGCARRARCIALV